MNVSYQWLLGLQMHRSSDQLIGCWLSRQLLSVCFSIILNSSIHVLSRKVQIAILPDVCPSPEWSACQWLFVFRRLGGKIVHGKSDANMERKQKILNLTESGEGAFSQSNYCPVHREYRPLNRKHSVPSRLVRMNPFKSTSRSHLGRSHRHTVNSQKGWRCQGTSAPTLK